MGHVNPLSTAGHNFFDQPVKKEIRTHNNIKKVTTSQGDYYTTVSLHNYASFKENFKLIAIDWSK